MSSMFCRARCCKTYPKCCATYRRCPALNYICFCVCVCVCACVLLLILSCGPPNNSKPISLDAGTFSSIDKTILRCVCFSPVFDLAKLEMHNSPNRFICGVLAVLYAPLGGELNYASWYFLVNNGKR
jgi:hypothetical protein